VANTSGSALTVSVYDSDDASESGDVEVCRMVLLAGTSSEFDMHGRICAKGLYAVKTGTGFFSLEWS
jgi:hypothetical protein|tara:strand:- start:3465 stop:3665 length:201 start_codon:yes stop_codon:yes gene_type:complete